MLTVLFDCLHNRDYTAAVTHTAPLIGGEGRCLKCGRSRICIGRSDCWVVNCVDCRYVTYLSKLAAEVKASSHMIKRRHRVQLWRQDTPNDVTDHVPDIPPDSLFDIPPF